MKKWSKITLSYQGNSFLYHLQDEKLMPFFIGRSPKRNLSYMFPAAKKAQERMNPFPIVDKEPECAHESNTITFECIITGLDESISFGN